MAWSLLTWRCPVGAQRNLFRYVYTCKPTLHLSQFYPRALKHFSCSAVWNVTRRFNSPNNSHTYPNYFIDSVEVQPSSFQELGIKASLCRALFRDGITVPTPIQSKALPVTLNKGNDCIIQSETGSGKTLTFLLPALQDPSIVFSTLILVPTRELASQVEYQALKLTGTKKIRKRVFVMFTSYGEEDEQMREYDRIRPHVLIGTPKRILQMLEARQGEFVTLRRLVLDEVDKLLLPLDERKASRRQKAVRKSHPRPVAAVLKKLLSVSSGQKSIQLICTSATANPALQEELEEIGWKSDIRFLSVDTSDTNTAAKLTAPRSIQHRYILCDPTDRMVKMDKIAECFLASGEKSALVFIHKEASVTKFVEGLSRRDVRAVPLYKQVLNHEDYSQFLTDFKSGKIQLAVGTQETVRGLDFTWLNTVYLTEVPRDANDYLHMCGRVGRLGKEGKVVVLLSGEHEQNRLLRQLSKLGVQGMQLEN